MSIPITMVIYRGILGIDYFCSLHVGVVIIIMGIGADDIFVFDDCWTHAKNTKAMRKRITLRLSYTFRKASTAMLITSLTTVVSFLATCLTPIMPICSFGIFSSLVITVNYLLIILAVPNIYLFYDKYIMKRFKCFKRGYRALKKCMCVADKKLKEMKNGGPQPIP
jgi:protein dispatched 1